ncbi:helix-turn-helix domain-containing protein [Flavobacterium sp. ZT3R18]|uniref:toprim domain-containing protein n=1 Tax=Flavobacterium sp. ZT3R18 TaxID=2594429 RepID=UPI00117A94E5|nr:toprim domain-containing protein [Flavobacterium sp. ZT3R18]TRX30278.1 helix-turn-helix domain-containing protein [Flavobacterium sp. ZT3R18]
MEIQQIKQNLTLATVLHYYNLKADKNNRLNCPFHEDKTPSLQVYYKTHTAYCFSSNCKTHGKSLDVIDFVMHKENSTKHEAILKAQEILGTNNPNNTTSSKPNPSREQFLNNIFQYFKNAVHSSKPTQDYLQSRNLDFKKIEVGYNAGQFHHGTRKTQELIDNCLQYGLLIDKGNKGRTGELAYNVFGKWSICFALKNKENQVTGLYFRSTLNEKESKHFYLKNRQGLYPNYPKKETKKLILTEAIIDTASLLQIVEITKEYSVLSCYGTNGLTEEHLQAIKDLQELEEIIFFFDGDKAGNEAVKKYSKQLQTINNKLKISNIETPENEDINSLLQGHTEEILIHLLEQRTELNFSFSIEDATTEVLKNPITNNGQLTTTIDFLKQKNLLQELNKLIEKSGIIGEENSRLLLFIIASSYKTKSPLHAIVQGSSGSGKTHLISKIADLIPQEDVLRFTRITESSLYNWGEFDLVNKLIIIEDLDGLKEEAMFAMRELISNQRLSSSVSIKDKKGNIKSAKKEVKGVFSSLSATTKGELYEDNMSRSFLLAVDESQAQSQRIIQYQNQRYAGEIDQKTQEKAKNQLQQIIRVLKDYEIINPYATKLELPEEVHKIRRLNEMFQLIIRQITYLNQHNRELKNNKLITQIEDLEQATEVLFESIILKVDELDGSLRQFFERLKKHLKTQDKDFTQREIRQAFNISKSQTHRYLQNLLELEYIRQIGGYANKGLKYKVDYWDDYQKLRIKIKDKLLLQIETLKNNK